MSTITTIDPVTRLEGHLKIQVTVDMVKGVQQVIDAKATGTLFRGFENILLNRHPFDAQHITQRICGVCPVSHGMAAVMALDAVCGVTAPTNARIMRNLVLGANLVDSHILHFYHLSAPDFLDGPNMPPWQPSWRVDKRFNTDQTNALVNNYVTALNMRRLAHEAGAIFGGRLPHPPTFIAGGFTTRPTSAGITKFKGLMGQVVDFIQNTFIPDAQTLAATYADYRQIGQGHRNLLAYGCFDLNSSGSSRLLQRGQVVDGSTAVQAVNLQSISENMTYSWYRTPLSVVPLDDMMLSIPVSQNPAVGVTNPVDPAAKTKAYSWLKAPRYNGLPYETGPLARMWVNGDYQAGISVMDRHLARAAEALKVAQAMLTWVDQINLSGRVSVSANIPTSTTIPSTNPNVPPVTTSFSAIGLTEAPRGALGHWLQVTDGKISRYQIVTPTCWNASPRDNRGRRGPMEEALIGTPVQDLQQPVEVVRVIHSFDPCLSCAVHVMRPEAGRKIFTLAHYHGGDEVHSHNHDHGHHGHEHHHHQNHGHSLE
jgi:hydrogenase large subunit